MSSIPSISPLPYADLPARWGVSVDRTPQSLRLVVPPVPGVKDLPRGYLFGTAILAAFVTFFAVMALFRPSPTLDDRAGFFVSLGLYGSVLVLLLWHGWTRLSRRIALEVNDSTLSIAHLARGGRVVSTATWPRHQVGGAKYNLSNGKLIIRIIGIDLVEVYVSPNRAVTEWVANVVDSALREIPASPLRTGGSASDPTSHSGPAIARGLPRAVAFTVAIVLVALGVALFFTPLAPLGVYVALLSVAPVGLALGTQEKEYYL